MRGYRYFEQVTSISDMPWAAKIRAALDDKRLSGVDENGWYLYKDKGNILSYGFRNLKEPGRYEVQLGGFLWQTTVGRDHDHLRLNVW